MAASLREKRLLEHQLRQEELLNARHQQLPLSRPRERPSSPPPPQQRIDRRSLPRSDLGYPLMQKGSSASEAPRRGSLSEKGLRGRSGWQHQSERVAGVKSNLSVYDGPFSASVLRPGSSSPAVSSFSFDANRFSEAVTNFPRRQPLEKDVLWPTGVYRHTDLEQLARPPAGLSSRDLHSRSERRFCQKVWESSFEGEAVSSFQKEQGQFREASESRGNVASVVSPPRRARTPWPSTQPPMLGTTWACGSVEGNACCSVQRASQNIGESMLASDAALRTSQEVRMEKPCSSDRQWISTVHPRRASQPLPLYSGEVAAGKPSSSNSGSFLQFHRSLRSLEQKHASSGERPRRQSFSSAPHGALRNPSVASCLDDEKALEEMGFNLSPRERAFLRRQQRMRKDRSDAELAGRCRGGTVKWRGGQEGNERANAISTKHRVGGTSANNTHSARGSLASKTCHLPPWLSAATVREVSFSKADETVSPHEDTTFIFNSFTHRPSTEECDSRPTNSGQRSPSSIWNFKEASAGRSSQRPLATSLTSVKVPGASSESWLNSKSAVCSICRHRLATEHFTSPDAPSSDAADTDLPTNPKCVACAAFEEALQNSTNAKGKKASECRQEAEGRRWEVEAVFASEKRVSTADDEDCSDGKADGRSREESRGSNAEGLVGGGLTARPDELGSRSSSPLPQVTACTLPKPLLSAKPKVRLLSKRSGSVEAQSGDLKDSEKEKASFSEESVWDRPRIVATVCKFLPLSKLLLLRQCSKTFLQATQYRMRFILYKALQCLIRNEPPEEGVPKGSKDSRYSIPHCPFSAAELIKLLNLSRAEVQALREGQLPPAFPPEASTPRMSDVARALRKYRIPQQSPTSALQDQHTPSRKTPLKKHAEALNSFKSTTAPVVSPCVKLKLPTRSSGPKKPSLRLPSPAVHNKSRDFPDSARAEQLNLYMTRLQREEEEKIAWEVEHQARLREQQEQADRFLQLRGDPSPPSVRISRDSLLKEPASFRRVRHSFLKLWNYDEATVRVALQRATTCPYPSWLFDACNLLLRAIFQVCSNSLTVPPLKELLPMLSPDALRSKPEGQVRADCYLWSRMARISGYGIEELITPARPRERQRPWNQAEPRVYRLRAMPLSNVHELWPGRNLNSKDLLFAAEAGVGAEGEGMKLRALVMDSLEGKMMRIPPEFLAEFVVYGKQQQMLHAEAAPHHIDRTIHKRAKFPTELVFLMDLYEWVAAILTHIRLHEATVSEGMQKAKSRGQRLAANESTLDGRSQVVGIRMSNRSARNLGSHTIDRQAPRRTVTPMTKEYRSSQTLIKQGVPAAVRHHVQNSVSETDAIALKQLIEEQGIILRQVCDLLASIKERGFSE